MSNKKPNDAAPAGIDAAAPAKPKAAEPVTHANGATSPVPEPPKAPAPSLDMLRGESCSMCRCSHFPLPDNPEAWGECRMDPPKVQIVMMPPSRLDPTQGPHFQPLAAWPLVRQDNWCVVGFQMKTRLQQ